MPSQSPLFITLVSLALLVFHRPVADGQEVSLDTLAERFPAAAPAIAAHRDGLASVAVQHIDDLLASGDVPDADSEALLGILVESLVRAGEHGRALDEIGDRDWPYWKGIALAGVGSYREALEQLKSSAYDPDHPHRVPAALAAASIAKEAGRLEVSEDILARAIALTTPPQHELALAAAETAIDLGDYGRAKELLSSSPESSASVSGKVLLAEAELMAGRPDVSASILEPLLGTADDLPSTLRSHATFVLFDALIANGDRAAAELLLKSSVEAGGGADAVMLAMDRLAGLGTFSSPDGRRLLGTWRANSNPAIASSANLQLSLLEIAEGRNDVAIDLLVPLADSDSPFALRAKLELVGLLSVEDDSERVRDEIAKLKAGARSTEAKARIQFIEARGDYLAGDFVSATANFSAAGGSEETTVQAAYNAALASLQAGDEEQFEERLALLPEVSGDASRSALSLERALVISEHARRLSEAATTPEERQAAAEQYKRASESLQQFLRDYPTHARAAEAHLALASLYLIAYFPSLSQPAREAVAKANGFELDPEQQEKAAYLAFWIEENDGEDPALAVQLAEDYLAPSAWAKSPRAPEVRMRQAEIHFRNGDYLDARLKFEQLVADYPDSELADTALFFAGRAAVLTRTDEGLEKALELWQKLVEKGSPLALPARRHQAQIRLRQGQQKQVIDLVNEITSATPPPTAALLISSLLLKGEAQAVLAGQGQLDPQEAIDTFARAREIEGASIAALNESLFREAQVHASSGDIVAALADYHAVVDRTAKRSASDGPPEYLWFYRSGFECIRLLQQKGGDTNIDAAIGIAVKLARTPGPRAAEANRVAELLKRENYRWD